MISMREIHNKPLISLNDGKKLGEVEGAYLDKDATTMIAVSLGKENLFSRKIFVIDRQYVTLFGEDAILVSASDKVADLETLPNSGELLLASELYGKEIQTEGGTRIATVEDILCGDDGAVDTFLLGKVFVQGPLAEKKTILRAAVIQMNSSEGFIIADLAKAE